jgi:hypothetical protein
MIANVRGLVTRKKLTQQKAEGALSLLKGVLDYTEFKDVDMVIEVGFMTSFLFNLVNSSRSTKHWNSNFLKLSRSKCFCYAIFLLSLFLLSRGT